MEVDLCSGDIVLGGDPAPPRKGAQQPSSHFRAMPIIVAKRLSISATAGLLFFSFQRV